MKSWFEKEQEKVKDTFAYKLASLEMAFTEKIIQLMEERGLNRKDLAERLNVSKAAISKLLNDGSNITLRRALAIAEALNCSISFDIVDTDKVASCDFSSGQSMIMKLTHYMRGSKKAVEDSHKVYGHLSPTDDYGQIEWNDKNAQDAA